MERAKSLTSTTTRKTTQQSFDGGDDFSSMLSSVSLVGEDRKEQANASNRVQWPCANCHSMVSEDRCPFCHGIQVKIRNNERSQNIGKAWIERVSPAGTSRVGVGCLLLPPRQDTKSPPTTVETNDIVMESAFVEIDEDDEAELKQTSESSPRYDYEDENTFGCRPNNPVACLLATAESPSPARFEKWPDMDQIPREDIKKNSKERVEDGSSSTPGKKQRVLFAM